MTNEFMTGRWQGKKLKARVTLDNSEMYRKIETQPQPSSGIVYEKSSRKKSDIPIDQGESKSKNKSPIVTLCTVYTLYTTYKLR